MEDKRREVLYQLSVMLEYANLTEKAKETVKDAISFIEQERDLEAEIVFAEKVRRLFDGLYEVLDNWKARNKQQPEEFQARILTDDELRMIEKPVWLWREDKELITPEEQKLLFIEDELEDNEGNQVELLMFEDGNDPMNLNGKTFRFWNRKPTAEEMKEEPWLEA